MRTLIGALTLIASSTACASILDADFDRPLAAQAAPNEGASSGTHRLDDEASQRDPADPNAGDASPTNDGKRDAATPETSTADAGRDGATSDAATPDAGTADAIAPEASCVPRVCASDECGAVSNGCNGVLQCGGCTGASACGVERPNRCDLAVRIAAYSGSCPPGTRQLTYCVNQSRACLDIDVPSSSIWEGNLDDGASCPAGYRIAYRAYCDFFSPLVCLRD